MLMLWLWIFLNRSWIHEDLHEHELQAWKPMNIVLAIKRWKQVLSFDFEQDNYDS